MTPPRASVGRRVLWRPRTKADQKALTFFTQPWLVHRILDAEDPRSRRSVRSLLLVPFGGDGRPVHTAARWVPEGYVFWVSPDP